MSQPFTAIATLIAKPGQQDLLEQGLRALVAPSRAEDGCSQYDLHRDLTDPQVFYVIEHWASEEILQAHNASVHFLHFQATAGQTIEHFQLKRLGAIA
ncbi:antibiotic biosynthesis monooxygenase [Pseudomonas sp. DTU12.3]|uniref:putative quinol monooxygenase n=1 Tax=Pseudomonas sp. DTU12.3 TaxID=2073078 RepID=UPI0010127429|nr:putative quinol monooxygenase [Pseudomonas sp. DTU12.3]QAX83164.1 antibiotic biosynthesis monooxygenase [Pseudomonas sp. DTU12.3]